MLLGCFSFLSAVASAQTEVAERESETRPNQHDLPTQFWPQEVEFDASIPTPKQFFGFDLGVRHLRHDQVVAYLKTLAAASDRIKLEPYGESHGFRPLLLLTITSPENHENLKHIQSVHRQLANPERSARVDIESLPAVINMGYGVHGDEPSATHCAVLVAYYLAAAQGDDIDHMLESNVILLDPALNPDGFDRFSNWANMYRGRTVNANPAHAEHQQSWHRGRTNYYWFDLNRDWLPLVHPESQGRMKWYHTWKPNVVLDYHEMGTNDTYFFQPGIPRRNHPLTPGKNHDLTAAIARYHAKRFDQRKTLYYSQEMFDDFYMGKGSSYPDLHGGVGILFEQASSRGHLQESENGLLSFPATIRNQFSTSLSSLEATTAMRQELLEYKRWFYRSSLDQALQDEVGVHVFVANGNESRLNALARLFKQHDITCYRFKERYPFAEFEFDPQSSLVVPVEQAEYRYLQSMIEKRTEFEDNAFYDISAWSIPLAFDVEHFELPRDVDSSLLDRFVPNRYSGAEFNGSDKDVAYLIDWRDDAAPKWLYQALSAGLVVKVATRPVTVIEQDRQHDFGFGTLMIPLGVEANRPNLVRRWLHQATRQGLRVVPVTTGLTAGEGMDLGSNLFRVVRKPEVALVVEGRVNAYEAGEVWHALDTQIEMPVTLLKGGSIGSLSRYNSLILVSGRYDASSSIETWVRDGGTLIATGSAVNFAASMLNRSTETEGGRPRSADTEADSEDKSSVQRRFIDARPERALRQISGAIFNARIDRTHPLFYGYERDSLPVFRNSTRSVRKSSSPYGNPLVYDAEEELLLAGYASQDNLKKMAGQPGLTIHSLGRGRIILMNDNPNFRGYWLGTQRAFFNAIFFGQLTNPPAGPEELVSPEPEDEAELEESIE